MTKLDLVKCSDLELVQRIEELWGDEVSHVAPLPSKEKGIRLFSCTDLGEDGYLWVHTEDSFVIVKSHKSSFGDILGTI